MNEFWINFLANISADTLLAIAIYIIVTQPSERQKQKRNRNQSMGLLKAEILVNHHRAKDYIKTLSVLKSDISELFPLRFSRGAWNALKDSGFLASIENPILSYLIFRMNESSLVANKDLRRYEIAIIDKNEYNLDKLTNIAINDTKSMLTILERIIPMLDYVKVPAVEFEGLFPEREEEVTVANQVESDQ